MSDSVTWVNKTYTVYQVSRKAVTFSWRQLERWRFVSYYSEKRDSDSLSGGESSTLQPTLGPHPSVRYKPVISM